MAEGDKVLFWKIVLTGGPCGGKTTALTEVSERLRSLGLQVFMQPEISTLLSHSGAGFPARDGPKLQHGWEIERLRLQRKMEEAFEGIAKSSKRPTVLLCDRGTGDSAAYCAASAWPFIAEAAMKDEGHETVWTEEMENGNAPPVTETQKKAMKALVDTYSLVIHMQTAAIGAEEFYTKAGNTARRESVEEAIEVDQNLMRAWDSHDHRRVVDNKTDFAGKIKKVITYICSHLDVLCPGYVQRRYIVSAKHFVPPPEVKAEKFRMIYRFLAGSTERSNRCIRVRFQDNHRWVTFSEKRETGEIIQCAITAMEAEELLKHPDPNTAEYSRGRTAFVTNGHYIEVDEFDANTCLMTVELENAEDSVVFPDWLRPAVVKELSPSIANAFSLYSMAVRAHVSKSISDFNAANGKN